MANYYVRPDGNDSNAGTGPATNQAWATVGKAIGASGAINPASPAENHTLYIAPGRYAEQITLGPSPTSTAKITVQGDPTGATFGVTPGSVILSAFANGDDSAPTGSIITMSAKSYYIFKDLIFHGDDVSGTGGCISAAPAANLDKCTNITVQRCVFYSQRSANGIRFLTHGNDASNWDIKECSFFGRGDGHITISSSLSNMTANTDIGVSITNCLFVGSVNAIVGSTTGTFLTGRPGGVDIMSCTFIGGNNAVNIANNGYTTAIPWTVTNCLILCMNTTGIRSSGANGTVNVSGAISQSYNRIIDCTAETTNVTDGGNTTLTGIHGIDAMAGYIQGYVNRLFWMPAVSGIITGDGTSTGQPTIDILGESRTGTTTIGAFLDTDVCPASGGLLVHPGMTGGIRG